MLRIILLASLTLAMSANLQAAEKNSFMWHTTHAIDKFPCMDDKEADFVKRLMEMQKIEQKKTLLSDHRKQVQPSSRRPASIHPEVVSNHRYICPPFKGVRNPYPQAIAFGKAASFERFLITDRSMDIINGYNKNEKWNMSYN